MMYGIREISSFKFGVIIIYGKRALFKIKTLVRAESTGELYPSYTEKVLLDLEIFLWSLSMANMTR